MRPDEAKSDIITKIDDRGTQYWIMYPFSWDFSQSKASSCKITLTMHYDVYKLEPERIERLTNFAAECRANGDRMAELYLETAGLTINRYKLSECMNIQISPNMHSTTGGPSAPSFAMYAITFDCLHYDFVTKINPDIKYKTFESYHV